MENFNGENRKLEFKLYLPSIIGIIIICIACIGCKNQAVAIDNQTPDYWHQNVYGDSLSAFPSHPVYNGIYPFGMSFSPVKELKFIPHTVMDDYWKMKHLFSFKDNSNHLVFREYLVNKKVYSYPLVYADITDSRIYLENSLHTGMSRTEVLRILKLKNVDDHIQTVSLTSGYDASATFYFADNLLKRVVIRTDKELLHNPEPVYENRYAGQVSGYTGNRLYAVSDDPMRGFSPVCYVDEKGDTIVPYGKYCYCASDSIAPVGFVIEKEKLSIACINTKGEVLCHSLVTADITPDYLYEGHFRIVNNEGLIGFADSLGHVVVTPQFKWAEPFQGGKAKVTYSGHKNDPNDEHWEWVSDDWFYIDYQGRKLPSTKP